MLLKNLIEYAKRMPQKPAMYKNTSIHWIIDLDPQGNFLGITSTASESGGRTQAKRYWVPHVQHTINVKAKLLADNGEYVLGIARKESKKDKVRDRHCSFLETVQSCAAETKEPSVKAVMSFLETFNGKDVVELSTQQVPNKEALLPKGFGPSQNIMFRVEKTFPTDLDSVQNWWKKQTLVENNNEGNDLKALSCIVCGKQDKIQKRHQFKIKGVPGGQSSGLALVSANADAFESYRLQNSLIAPMCYSCTEGYARALNTLHSNDACHINIGPIAYRFWTREEHPFSPANLLSSPDPSEVKQLIKSAFSGSRASNQIQDDTQFYAVTLSASGSRLVIRDYIDTTVSKAKKNLALYFLCCQIVSITDDRKPLGIYALARSFVNKPKDVSSKSVSALLHFALKGDPLPNWLLFKAISRNRAEQRITHPRAALIKAILLSQKKIKKEDEMVNLNQNHPEAAYHCGRLLAVLESIQYSALGSINATITDRYFGSASTAPASVFGNLLKGAQNHLGTLRKIKHGAYVALEKHLEEVLGNLSKFPNTLSLQQQALFSLGYYHQKAANRNAAKEHKNKKEKEENNE